ncbi:YjbF family lipoprotein [Tropicimonas sp.]|uniref:YjbF family lipoprotein n=1 Tax=Tropicimonas sp. TaxID=2067044 RepID=UPI003A842F2A
MTSRNRAGRRPSGRILVLPLALTLAACGNNPEKAQGWRGFAEAVNAERNSRQSKQRVADSAGAADQQATIRKALAANKGPMMLAVMETTQRPAVIGAFGRNGPYVTYRTASQQTLTFRDGVLTGTRGLGYELLSSEADGSIALIGGRREGTAQRVYWHLSGENHSVPTRMTCEISRAGNDPVVLADGRSVPTTRMTESCRADDLKIRNSYWVSDAGTVLQSIQWVSPEVGKIAFQTLRP